VHPVRSVGDEAGVPGCDDNADRARGGRRGEIGADPHRPRPRAARISSCGSDPGTASLAGPLATYIYVGPRNEQARDTLITAGGNDFVKVVDCPAPKHVVNCGDGRDRVAADYKDLLSGCERVT
jgi:hypothetical protein